MHCTPPPVAEKKDDEQLSKLDWFRLGQRSLLQKKRERERESIFSKVSTHCTPPPVAEKRTTQPLALIHAQPGAVHTIQKLDDLRSPNLEAEPSICSRL